MTMRAFVVAEDAVTVAKAATLITELSGKTAAIQQQMMRWVMNKESHAQKIIETVAMIISSPAGEANDGEGYPKLYEHHSVMLAAMKAKQSADPAVAEKLAWPLTNYTLFITEST